jgi:hypothetical protein
MKFHNHSTAETGIGETTGDIYVARFEENSTTEKGHLQTGNTKHRNLLNASAIGKGSVPNLRYGARVNVILNANGTMTASIDDAYITCE